MIVLSDFAEKCIEVCRKSRRATSYRAHLYQALIHLNLVFDKTKWADSRLTQWTEYEVAAAEAILWLVAFLHLEGCADIDKLLKDVAEYRDAHPDVLKTRG